MHSQGHNETYKVFLNDIFAAVDARDEYQLTNAPIMAQSEEVVIETRDRFQVDIVLSRQILVRYLDYKLDYRTGKLSFLRAVNARDDALNANIIVVDYVTPRCLTHNEVKRDFRQKQGLMPRRAKYLLVTIGILMSGVAMMGIASGHIFSPQAENDFLHEHLHVSADAADLKWEVSDFILPPQDKQKIAQIVTQAEKSNLALQQTTYLTGQALDDAQEKSCQNTQELCRFPVRLNRSFKAAHGNNDFRVVNVEEKSLRVDVEVNAETQNLDFNEIVNETRLLRFYQTKVGWMQNTTEIIQADAPVFTERHNKFKDKFSKTFIGINYYPASASWREFWTEFPIEIIQSDLKSIRALNANSVRIFLTHDYFDRAATREEALSKLDIFLKLCEENNIKVLVTLFDLRPNYELSNLQADIDHINHILPVLMSNTSILGVDIKNQADLDFENWGQDRVKGWLTVMMRHIHLQYPDVALTVGWSKADRATGLKDIVDFVTYHEYINPDNFGGRLNKVVSAVGGKPVMITELGSTVWTPFKTKHKAEAKQALRLETQLSQAGPASGIFLWTLHDFDHVGREVVGPLPWRQAQQRHFGLMRSDGTARPATDVFRDYGARHGIDKPTTDFANLNRNSQEDF